MNISKINIIGTIFDNSSQHAVALADQILDEDYKGGTKQSVINKELKDRIGELATSLESLLKGNTSEGSNWAFGQSFPITFGDHTNTTEPTVSGDGTKHIILTSAQYNALSEYENNAIYFIVDSTTTWGFGDGFPIILTN